jgi:flagellar motor component MotA
MKKLSKDIRDLHSLIAVAFNNMTEEQQKQTIMDFEDEVELSENDFITDFLENVIENFSEFKSK